MKCSKLVGLAGVKQGFGLGNVLFNEDTGDTLDLVSGIMS